MEHQFSYLSDADARGRHGQSRTSRSIASCRTGTFWIRPRCQDDSFREAHITSSLNSRRSGWHPEFVARLRSVLESTAVEPRLARSDPLGSRALLNPAFTACGRRERLGEGTHGRPDRTPFSLAFLLVPIVIHPGQENSLPRNDPTSLAAWLAEHAYLRETFPAACALSGRRLEKGSAVRLPETFSSVGRGRRSWSCRRSPAAGVASDKH